MATKSPEPLKVELTASELPESILSRFSPRPSPLARFTITIEAAQSDEEKLAALKRDIDAGLADLDTRRLSDGEAVFGRLKAKFPVVIGMAGVRFSERAENDVAEIATYIGRNNPWPDSF